MISKLTDCSPETDHDRHMCSLVIRKQMHTAGKLAKNGEFFCKLCGRVAAESNNVCAPIAFSEID